MRHGFLVLLLASAALEFSCKSRNDHASVASAADEDAVCIMPKGVPVLTFAIDPAILPKDDPSSPQGGNSPFMAKMAKMTKAIKGIMLINQFNNDLCRDHDNDYVAQVRVANSTDEINPIMHAVISPNAEPNLGDGILKLFSSKGQPPCHEGSAWVNMAKLAKDTSNNPGTMSRFMADAYQFSFLFIGRPGQSGGKPTCAAGISSEELAAKKNEFEIAATKYLNGAR